MSRIPFALILLLALPSGNAFAQIRPGEPVILTGSDLPGLSGAPVGHLHLFSLDAGLWTEIPVQVDERSAAGSLFEVDDGLWDANDELVFQPQDGGASASTGQWIPDGDSSNHSRYEISVLDPVVGGVTFVYVYRSITLPDTVSTTYVAYHAVPDEIEGSGYKAGFDAVGGFWNELRIDENGSWSSDLVDRQKVRIKGQIGFFNYLVTESDLSVTSLLVKAGRIRVTRETQTTISFLGTTLSFTGTQPYYGSFLGGTGGVMDVHPTFTMLRSSLDLTPDALGAIISTSANPALPVDGVPDAGVQTVISLPEIAHYWVKMSFSGSSIVTLGNFSGVSSTNRLYYHDNAAGGTGDGTPDSGDMVSYGDAGLMFLSPTSGQHAVSSSVYLGIGVDLSGPTCQAYFDSPFQIAAVEQTALPTGVSESPLARRHEFALGPNRPNPFGPRTVIDYELPSAGRVRVSVHDVSGRLIEVLVEGHREAGPHRVAWSPGAAGAGVYFYRIETGDSSAARKCLLVK